MVTNFLSSARSGRSNCALPVCLAMLILLAAGCTDDKPVESSAPPPDPAAASVDPGDCLLTDAMPPYGASSVETCITFSYSVDSSVLSLTHTNVIFNCCPYQISFDVTLEGSQLTISESEDSSLCDCVCPFDVEFAVTDLVAGDYQITILEQYSSPSLDTIKFDLSLTGDTSGTVCFSRDPGADSASGALVSHSGCKSGPDLSDQIRSRQSAVSANDTTADYSCVAYSYDGTDLTLEHVNAGFNCCPDSLHAAFEFNGSHITITESETFDPTSPWGCGCLCLYDLTMAVEGLSPGIYSFEFVEPYRNSGDDKLEFHLDLRTATEGIICVQRTYYPWGLPPG